MCLQARLLAECARALALPALATALDAWTEAKPEPREALAGCVRALLAHAPRLLPALAEAAVASLRPLLSEPNSALHVQNPALPSAHAASLCGRYTLELLLLLATRFGLALVSHGGLALAVFEVARYVCLHVSYACVQS